MMSDELKNIYYSSLFEVCVALWRALNFSISVRYNGMVKMLSTKKVRKKGGTTLIALVTEHEALLCDYGRHERTGPIKRLSV
jgi:hypothetical protein